MKWVIDLLGGKLVETVGGILKSIIGDREKRDAAVAQEQKGAQAELAAEFARSGPRTWWDSLVDGLNRLPRPLIAFGVLGLMVYAPADPAGFARVMQAYAIVPEWLALLFAQVILLYFGGRMLDKWSGRLKPVPIEEVRAIVAPLQPPAQPAAGSQGADEDGDGDLSRSTPPASTPPSIDKWRAKQKREGRD